MLKKKEKTATIDVIEAEEKQKKRFAQGLNFYKLFWVFFIGCFMGVVIETVFVFVTAGRLESRTGLVLGPFNLVYGFGALAMAVGLYPLRNKRDGLIMLGGAAIGSAVEYACAWVQMQLFGSASWDYSAMPFNLHGRINLLYSLFWGILAVIWVKEFFPRMSQWIMKIPNTIGVSLTWVLVAFMVVNTALSGMAVLRWAERTAGDAPQTQAVSQWLDKHYPDARMARIYPSMEFSAR